MNSFQEYHLAESIIRKLDGKSHAQALDTNQTKYIRDLVSKRFTKIKDVFDRVVVPNDDDDHVKSNDLMERDAGNKVTRVPWGGVSKIVRETGINQSAVSNYLRGYKTKKEHIPAIKAAMVKLGYEKEAVEIKPLMK